MEALLYYTKINKKLYSDVVYKKKEWERFEKWYNNEYGKDTKRD